MKERIRVDKQYFEQLERNYKYLVDLVPRVYWVIKPCNLLVTESEFKGNFKVVSRANGILKDLDLEVWHLSLNEIQAITDIMRTSIITSGHCREQWEHVLKVAKELDWNGGEEPDKPECLHPNSQDCQDCKMYIDINDSCAIGAK